MATGAGDGEILVLAEVTRRCVVREPGVWCPLVVTRWEHHSPRSELGERTLAVPQASYGGAQGLLRGRSRRWETEMGEVHGSQQAQLPLAEGGLGEGRAQRKNRTAPVQRLPAPTPSRVPH